MKKFLAIILNAVLCASAFAAEDKFYVAPIGVSFEAEILSGGARKADFGCFGNIDVFKLTAEEQKEFKTPFAVMRQLLWIFKTSEDFSEVEALIAPSLSAEAKSVYKKMRAENAKRKDLVRKIGQYEVWGYFIDKNAVVVFYQLPKEVHLSSFVFLYEKDRWYLGELIERQISENLLMLCSEASRKFAQNEVFEIKLSNSLSPAQKESLMSDKEAVNFYEKLSPIYGLPQIPKN